MKKIIYIFLSLLIIPNVFAQTKTLSDLLQEYNQKSSEYPKIVYQGKILMGNYDIFPTPYSFINWYNGKFNLFINKAGVSYIYSTPDFISWTVTPQVNMKYGSTAKIDGTFYTAYHKWFNTQSFYYFQKNFTDVSMIRDPQGEDITFLKLRNGKFRAYARMNVPPAVRTIGVMESDNFINWTPLQEILAPDAEDNGKEYYSMSVIETDDGFYGFMNVYNPRNEKMTIRLIHSEDGITDWKWLNNRNPVIPLQDREQLYASASVIGDQVYISTISAKFNHSEENRNGRYYYTELWKIDKEVLTQYLDF